MAAKSDRGVTQRNNSANSSPVPPRIVGTIKVYGKLTRCFSTRRTEPRGDKKGKEAERGGGGRNKCGSQYETNGRSRGGESFVVGVLKN